MNDSDNNPKNKEPQESILDAGNISEVSSEFIQDGKSRPIGAAFSWLKQAVSLFKEELFFWIPFILASFALIYMLQMLGGMMGALLSNFVSIIVMGLSMKVAHQQAAGEDIGFQNLFDGFEQKHVMRLLYVVLILLVMTLVLFMLAGAIISGLVSSEFIDFLKTIQSSTPEFTKEMIAELKSHSSDMFMILGVLYLVLLPVTFVSVFSPGFIMLSDSGVKDAVLQSLKGGFKNLLPCILFSTIAIVLFVVASIPAMLGLIIFLPVMFICFYTSFRDIFMDEPIQTDL